MKPAITVFLALGVGLAAAANAHAAAVPTAPGAMQAAVGANGGIELAQAVTKVPGRGPAVRGPVGGVPRGGFVPRGGAPGAKFVPGPRVGGVGPRPGFYGRPGYVYRGPVFVRAYRPWYRRPYFGTIVGGVALGTILTVAAVGVAPAYPPADGLCWYWADPSQTTGYWDYCY